MTYNTELQSKNDKIRSLIEVANSLPEAGDGDSSSSGVEIETYIGTVYGASGLGDMPDITYIYTDETLARREVILPKGEEAIIVVAANTCILQYSDFNYMDWITDSGTLSPARDVICVYIPIQNNFEIW